MRIQILLITLMRIRIRIPLFTLMRIRIQIIASKWRLKPFEKVLKYAQIPHILASCHLQIDADPHMASDPAYHFDADPDPDF